MKAKNRRLNQLPSVEVIIATAMLVGDNVAVCNVCDGTRVFDKRRCYYCGGVGVAAMQYKTVDALSLPVAGLSGWQKAKYIREKAIAKKAASREL